MQADVWFQDQLAATLSRTGDAISFSYTPEYLASGTRPVASTLPFSEVPLITRNGAVPAFFAGLLPEGRRLSSVKKLAKASADDELALLLAVGADPVGAVSVVPAGSSVPTPAPSLDLHKDLDFSAAVSGAGIADPIALPGVQDKASARTISLPFGSDAILKLSPPEFPYLVENEAACYSLAHNNRLRLATSTVEVLSDNNNRSGLLVRRFDRFFDKDGKQSKYAVEDAAQLLNLWPAQKYDPSYEDIAQRIAEMTSTPMLALRNIAFQIAFAWLTGNGDLHAKNFSVIDYGRGYEMTPIYDIPSTLPYGDNSLALSVQGSTSGLSAKKFRKFCVDIGLTTKAAESVIAAALTATTDAAHTIINACQFMPRQERDICRVLDKRRHMWI